MLHRMETAKTEDCVILVILAPTFCLFSNNNTLCFIVTEKVLCSLELGEATSMEIIIQV